jgi:hypothetical protein
MDPVDQLRATRKAIDASVTDFAALVGLTGDSAARSIRAIEAGTKPLVGPMIPLLRLLEPGLDIGTLSSAELLQVPEFVALASLAPDVDYEGVMHTRYPRFLGVYSGLLPDGLRERLENSGMSSVATPEGMELGRLVGIAMDPFEGDLVPLLQRAAEMRFGGRSAWPRS